MVLTVFITVWFLSNASLSVTNNATTKPIPAAFKAMPKPLTAVPIALNPLLPDLPVSSNPLSNFFTSSVTSPIFDLTSISSISFAILKSYVWC